MKYASRVILILVICVVAIGAIYYEYFHVPIADIGTLTTAADKEPTTEPEKEILLASLEDDDFALFLSNGEVFIEHKNQRSNCGNWGSDIDKEDVEMYYRDFTSDDKKDLLVKYYIGKDETTKKSIYQINLIKINRDKEGKYVYNINAITSSTWKKLFNLLVTQEMSQLQSSDKRLQFSMITGGNAIQYDPKTGISKTGISNYALALKKNSNEYATLDSWKKGSGYLSVKDGKIYLDIDIITSYKELNYVQYAGLLQTEIHYSEMDGFRLTEGSVRFKANEEYKVSRPSLVKVSDWNYTLTNTNPQKSDSTITWSIKDFEIKNSNSSASFYSDIGESKRIEKIVVSKNKVVLYSKSPFSNENIKKGLYSVIINEGQEKNYEISYNAKVSNAENGSNKLTINFDKDYSKDEIKTIKVNFGTKR